MFVRLRIQNYALLHNTELIWDPHLNLLTGETGAGKSLLVESLMTLLGYKTDLPPLTEKAVIEAEFTPVPEAAFSHLEEPTDSLILRCEIYPNGRRRFFMNDSPIPAQTLREIAYYLVEIHSQHESQQLFHAHFQREILDSYADLGEELQAYRKLYETWKERRATLVQLEKEQMDREMRLSWISTQVEELKAAALSTEEYTQLEELVRRLDHQSQAIQLLSQWLHQLSEGPRAPIALLREAEKSLGRLPLSEIQSIQSHLEQARTALQEASSEIETLLSTFSIDSAEAERIRQRYDTYNTLLIKYRVPTVEALIELRDRLFQEYETLQQVQEKIGPLRAEVETLTQAVLEKAYHLELGRIAAAQTLSDHVQGYLGELGLGYAYFHVAVERLLAPESPYQWEGEGVQLTPHGFSGVSFLLRTAPNFPLAPLAQVASGGELSRIMLALKAALAEKIQLPTLILDEIDTGLSGEGARRMGEFIRRLSQRTQVVLITHLPAIAAQPGTHFYIWKENEGGSWRTQVKKLSPEERIREIARLLSGEMAGEAAFAAARELLNLPSL
ncbi:MAG: DNA repair protein RecN [Bacteroidia bacterium]|nr:DNA repair protein RecN [Bacteroidia bacterium]MCX7763762.1 DNA repair protein RecN [Bacteroidia bacterium]MDW8058088.1 DNA repair protein RecN [Bacteroidia bacterium]